MYDWGHLAHLGLNLVSNLWEECIFRQLTYEL